MSFEATVKDGGLPTDDVHPTITIAHHEPMTQVSQKAKHQALSSLQDDCKTRKDTKLCIPKQRQTQYMHKTLIRTW